MRHQRDIHKSIAGPTVTNIVKPVIENGGKTSDVMVLLESVVAGVLLACEEIDQDPPSKTDGMLMGLENGVRERLINIRKDRQK